MNITDEQFIFVMEHVYTRKREFTDEDIESIKSMFPFDDSMDPMDISHEFSKAAVKCLNDKQVLLSNFQYGINMIFGSIHYLFGHAYKVFDEYEGETSKRFKYSTLSRELFEASYFLLEYATKIVNEFAVVLYYVYGGTKENPGTEYDNKLDDFVW